MNPDLSFVSPFSGRIDLGWYTKDLLPVGHWEGVGFELDVDEEFLKSLSANTNKVIAKGIDVPFQDGHTSSALMGEGFLRDTWVGFNADGDLTLYGLTEITGRRASEKIEEGSLKNVSVGILADFVDGEGESFGPALDHVALTPFPVVHRQSEFSPAPDRLELDRGRLPEKVECGGSNRILMSRSGSSGVAEMAISDRPWSEIDATSLPRSAFLLVEEGDSGTKVSLPVYEGAGPLVSKDGVTVHADRGPINRSMVRAAALALLAGDYEEEIRKKVARRLLGLYTQIGEKAPESLKAVAGVEAATADLSRLNFEIEVYGSNGPIKVKSLKDLIALREEEEERRTAWWALQDYFYAVQESDMTSEEKKSELKSAIEDFVDALNLGRAEGSVRITMRRPGIGSGPQPKEAGMKDLLKKAAFKALCARLGIEIPEDAGDEFVEGVLSKADEQFGSLSERVAELSREPEEPAEPPKPTPVATLAKDNPEVAAMAREVKALREERQKNRLSRATEAKDKALSSGRLTAEGADAYEALLCVEGDATRLTLSKGAVGTDKLDVRGLVQKLVDSLPEGAALDMEERTKRLGDLAVVKTPSPTERTSEDIEKTADEQVSLARQGTVVTGKGG